MTPSVESWVEQARAVPMADVLAKRNIKLAGSGDKLKGPCPICGGDDRFAVDLGKPAFNCRGCGMGGYDSISLVRFLDGVNFKMAVETLAGQPQPAAAARPSVAAPSAPEPKKIVVARFDYEDENGALLFQVERVEFQNPDGSWVLKDGKRKKSFRQRRLDPERPGNGSGTWKTCGPSRIASPI